MSGLTGAWNFNNNIPKKSENTNSKNKTSTNYKTKTSTCWVVLTADEKAYCKERARELRDDGIIENFTYSDYFRYLLQKERFIYDDI